MALTLGVLVFAGACFWLLSPWQFGRNSEQVQQNDALTSALRTPAVPLGSLHGSAESLQWREISVRGHYLPADEALARLRVINEGPAYNVLTVFQQDNGQALLINRGYLNQQNGVPPPYSPAPSGELTLHARIHPDETGGRSAETLNANGKRQVYAISSATVGRLFGAQLRAGTFTLTQGQPGALNVEPLPQIDSGPFLSYAIQWILFGVMALLGLGYFTRRELQPGGALTPEARAQRKQGGQAGNLHGRKAVAAAIAEEERQEHISA